MKKIFKKVLGVLLAVSTMLSCGVACGDKSNGGKGGIVETIDAPSAKSDYVGTHDFSMTEREDYLVRGGETEYVLVTKAELTAVEQTAKEEFLNLFQAATNIRMQTCVDEGLTHNANAKYISLGETALFETSGLTLDKQELSDEGVRIVTKDKTIYLLGGGQYGTLYAVYDFMQLTFDYEQYYLDCLEIETNVKNKKLYDYDVTDIPDMNRRSTGYAFMTQEFKNRMRIPLYSGNYFLPIHSKMTADGKADRSTPGLTAHNSNEYLPRADYPDHDEWFGDSGDVLCYTAHGDPEELELMAQECAKKVAASLMTYTTDLYPNMNAVSLTVEDNNDSCACDACTACINKYGTTSASIILFMNKFNGYVRQWLEENKDNELYYRENFDILFFAYNSFALAPSSWDEEKGEYVANAPELVLDDGVYVWLALMNIMEEELNIYHPRNDRAREQIEKWGAISNNGLWLWTYSTNFSAYLYFHDSFSMYNAEGYQYLADHNVRYYYQNAQSYQTGTSTAFHNMSLYLQTKLTWNTSLDTEELIDNYMNAMFKEAAPIMKELFVSMRLHNRQIKEQIEYSNSIENSLYFPYNTLKHWTDLCDDALAAIDFYQTQDPKTYQLLKDHIEAEWVYPAYATLQLRGDYVQEKELISLKQRFREVVLRLGITRTKEIEADGTLTTYVNSL